EAERAARRPHALAKPNRQHPSRRQRHGAHPRRPLGRSRKRNQPRQPRTTARDRHTSSQPKRSRKHHRQDPPPATPHGPLLTTPPEQTPVARTQKRRQRQVAPSPKRSGLSRAGSRRTVHAPRGVGCRSPAGTAAPRPAFLPRAPRSRLPSPSRPRRAPPR